MKLWGKLIWDSGVLFFYNLFSFLITYFPDKNELNVFDIDGKPPYVEVGMHIYSITNIDSSLQVWL